MCHVITDVILKRGRPASHKRPLLLAESDHVVQNRIGGPQCRILGNEAFSILKHGRNYNNNSESEECCPCIVNVTCYTCYSI